MPSLKPFAPHGLVAGLNPADSLTAVQQGKLVVPPFAGPMQGLPTWMDPMAFSYWRDDFYRYEVSGSDVGGWLKTDIGNGLSAGPVISANYSLNGELNFATDDTAQGDGAIWQLDVDGVCNLASTRPYWVSMRVHLVSLSNFHVRCGLGATTANPFSADPNGVFFVIGESTNGQLGTIVKNAGGTTETANTGSTLTAGQWHELAFHYDGNGSVFFYMDRTLVDTVTTNIPTGLGIEPFFAGITRGATGTLILSIDFFQVVSLRPANA